MPRRARKLPRRRGHNAVAEELRSMKLKEATKKIEDGIEETLTCFDFPANTGLASTQTMS